VVVLALTTYSKKGRPFYNAITPAIINAPVTELPD